MTGIPASPETARSFHVKGAQFENEGCLLVLGCNYYNGDGVQRDYGKAFDLWEYAAETGSPMALSNLGLLYSDGKGVVQDVQRALEYEQHPSGRAPPAATTTSLGSCKKTRRCGIPTKLCGTLMKGGRKWKREDGYDTLVKAERYPEARSALQRWIGFHQKKHNTSTMLPCRRS